MTHHLNEKEKKMLKRLRTKGTMWAVLTFALLLTVLFTQAAIAGDKSKDSYPLLLDAGPAPEAPLSSVAEDAEPFTASEPDDFVVGEMLIKFKEHVAPNNANIAALMQDVDGHLKLSHKKIGVHLFKMKTAKTKEKTLKAIGKFKKHPLVEFAEPNGIIQAIPVATETETSSDVGTSYVPNDPYRAYQYGLSRIYAYNAWDLTKGDPNSYVAVVDTGVNWMHPDLSGKVYVPADRLGNCIAPGTWPMDDHGHGTHVAGIAAAKGNNGIGIAGVAFNERILAVKVLNSAGSGTWSSVACGINMAAAIPSVKAINLSLGGPYGSSTLYSAVYNAWVTYGKTVVAANGNNGSVVPSPYSYPGCYSRNGIAIAVGATDYYNNRAPYSSANACINVAAPGDRILSTYSKNYSTANSYAYLSGTSMAAPHVSGTVGLMQHYWPRSNNAIRYYLSATAADLGPAGWDIYYGYGLINALRAVRGY